MGEVVFKAVENEEELRLAVGLMAQTRHETHDEAVRWGETVGPGHPNSRPDHTRVAMVENHVAGALRITTDTIRIGEARLKMGGIGWIATSPRFRNQGIARDLIIHTNAYLKNQNYHVAMLFTHHNFYRTLGFTATLNDYSYCVDTLAALDLAAPDYRIRSSKPGDIPAMQRLHAAGDREVACSIVRNGAHFINRWDVWRKAQVINDLHGRVVGYFLPRIYEQSVHIEEAASADDSGMAAIVHAAASIGMEQSRHKLSFSLPPQHPCARFLEARAAQIHLREERELGGLLAFMQRAETLQSMIPEWENALSDDPLAAEHVEVVLVVEGSQIRITAHRGAIGISTGTARDKVGFSDAELLHLLTGHDRLNDVLERHRRILSPRARAFLRLIFPQRTPFVWPVDRF